MFEFIRTHKKWMQILLALIILPSFVLVGVSSFTGGGGGPEVAVVANQKITQQEWEEAQRQEMDRYRATMGERFDPKLFETPEAKQRILDRLVAERAVAAEVRNGHLTVGDASVEKQIMDAGGFKRPDGSIDIEQYKATLAAQRMNEAQLYQRVRTSMALGQLNGAIEGTAFAPRTVSTRLADIVDQEREVQELQFAANDFTSKVNVSDAMVKAYYDKNTTLFQVPEQIKIEYVLFDAAVVESQVSVSDAEISDFYTKSIKSFGTPEQRTSSHILINVKKGASAADKAAAKAKAEAILAEVRKAPTTFAAVAKAQSQDPASAETGGDLGQVEQEKDKDALPAPVMATIFKLKEGEVSDVVESDFGYHVIMLTGLKPAHTKPLDEVKLQVAAELKKQKMSKKYSELAETFNNTVEDQFDSLKPVADKLNLKIQTVDNLTRTPSPVLGTSPYNNAKFLSAIFADETLKGKRNTRAVEVAATTMVAGRVLEYRPSAKRALAEVEPAIRAIVTKEEAAKLARKAGQAKLVALKAADDAAGFGETKVVSRNKPPALAQAAALEVLKADVSKLPAYVGVELPGAGYGVYRISKVSQPAQPDPAARAAMAEQINGAVGQVEMYGYVEALKTKAKAKVYKPLIAADAK